MAIKRHSSNLHRLVDIAPNIIFYDVEDLEQSDLLQKESIDAVLHAATSYGRSGESYEEIYAANLKLPLQILKMASAAKVRVFMNVDTIIPSNTNLYSLSKREFHSIGKQFADQKFINFINVRLEHLYGPGDDAYKFVPWLIEGCLKNVSNIALTAGEQLRDFIYVSDAAAGLIKILKCLDEIGGGYQEIELGNGNAILMQKFIKLVHKLTGSTSKLGFGEIQYRNDEPMFSQANLSRMTQLQWQPMMDLERGLQITIESQSQKECSIWNY